MFNRDEITKQLIKVAREVLGDRVPMTKQRINRFRKDFLTLMKNVKRADSYEKVMLWSKVQAKWSDSFEDYVFKYLIDSLHDLDADSIDKKNWERRIRKETWSLVVNLRVPMEFADNYWSKEERFYQYQKKLNKWERRVRNAARGAWDSLIKFVEWLESENNSIEVFEPKEENLNISGLSIILKGHDQPKGFSFTKAREYIDRIIEGAKIYKSRAGQVSNALLRYKIPVVVDFRMDFDKGGEYKGGKVFIYANSIESPKLFVQILAHEMGHHLWHSYLSKKDQELWYKFISGNYGKLDLEKVIKEYKNKDRGHLFFNKVMMKEDPILYLQVNGLMHSPAYKNVVKDFFQTKALEEAILNGKIDRFVNVQVKPITSYASLNSEEAFCEVLGLLVAYGNATVDEEVRQVFNTIVN